MREKQGGMRMGGWNLDMRCEVRGLLYESQICLEAAAAGMKTVAAQQSGEVVRVQLGVLSKMVEQAGDALEALHKKLAADLGGENG
jgi:hypothetical protein